MSDVYEDTEKRIAEIEHYIDKLWPGLEAPAPYKPNMGPFGMYGKMAFSQWLKYVFVVRVREIISERGEFPGSSQVSAQAAREFDGFDNDERYQSLLQSLSDFDDFINNIKY